MSVDQLTNAFSKSLTLEDNTDLIKKVDAKELNELQSAELHQWLTISSRFPEEQEIEKLNDTLKGRTYLLDATQSASVVDAIVLARILKHIKQWSNDQVVAHRHIVRWADLIQNSVEGIPDSDKIKVDVDLEAPREFKAKPEKKGGKGGDEQAPKDKKNDQSGEQASNKKADKNGKEIPAGVKTEKKEKKKKQPQAPKEEKPVTPGMIDLRVGWIEKAVKHPDADSLYVSTIHMGDEDGNPRTVCSGLVKYVPIEDMQDRLVVCVANLKPVNMRGIKSCAMVLCASNEDTVEFVNPPAGSKAGDKIFFETYDMEPEKQLNPKKKIWEAVQPGFTTNESLEVVFQKEGDEDRKLVNKSGELCKVNSLAKAAVR